nr:hypothetical protein CPGR_00773 [Mycolicibacter nonchromogenicus]
MVVPVARVAPVMTRCLLVLRLAPRVAMVVLVVRVVSPGPARLRVFMVLVVSAATVVRAPTALTGTSVKPARR